MSFFRAEKRTTEIKIQKVKSSPCSEETLDRKGDPARQAAGIRGMKLKNLVLVLGCAVAILSACGGGSGGSSGSSDSSSALANEGTGTTFPIESVIEKMFTAQNTSTETYTNPTTGGTETVTRNNTPGTDSTFEGQAAKTATGTETMTATDGVWSAPGSWTNYFQTGPFKFLGTFNNTTGEYTVEANQATLPAFGKIGDSGNFSTATYYSDSTKAHSSSTGVSTWELQAADTENTAYLCVNSTSTFQDKKVISGSSCLKIDTNGTILGTKFTSTSNGVTQTFIGAISFN